MNIDVKRHEGYFEKFRQQFPIWGDETIRYVPKNSQAIRVTLRSGDEIDFNAISNTFHVVRREKSGSPRDIKDSDCRDAFSSNLVEMMRARGVSQTTLAELTGLSTASISKYLRREATPTITNLRRIALALNCAEEELIH